MKNRKKWLVIGTLFLVLAIWIAWGDRALMRTDYTVKSAVLPDAFDGFRIVHISDLHNTEFGTGNETLLAMIREAKPDMIAITGDLIDSRRTDVDVAISFAREAAKIAPCYYVTGNHELRVEEFSRLEAGLRDAGVIVLRGEAAVLERNGQSIRILGVDDPSLISREMDDHPEIMKKMLEKLAGEGFSLLLAHRPELFDVYCEQGMDLVLAGHAHGGQIRLPFIGGIYASGRFFPEYEDGHHVSGGTNMVVSRGLGNSLFPFRVNNRPEVVVVTLRIPEE